MKGLIIYACSVLLLISCEKYTITRVYRATSLPTIGKRMRDTSTARTMPGMGDTVIYLSAVNVPESYDWRRDTSYGAVPCELVFMKNGEPQFSVTTGAKHSVSPSPETHHIMDGHLYTEYNSGTETIICRDGVPLLRYQGREILKGLALRDGCLISLGCDRDRGGVVLRRDGEVLLRQDGGTPFGDFSSLSPRTGALYEDGGKLCFCFKTSTACYKVEDGAMTQVQTNVNASRVVDMRIFLGQVYYIGDYINSALIFTPLRSYSMPTSVRWKDLRLVICNNHPYIVAANDKGECVCKDLRDLDRANLPADFYGDGLFIYPHSDSHYAVSYSEGNLKVQKAVGNYIYVRDSSYYFGAGCACVAGETIFIAVTPREAGQPPFVWHDGTGTPCALNGYITGIEVEVSPPS